MKKVLCLSIVMFISVFFTCHAQSDEYKQWWSIVNQKNESLQNGKIDVDYFYRKKDSTDFVQKPYTCYFSKEITYQKKSREVRTKFNVFDTKDSMQYIYDLNCLVTINHKKKTFELDTPRHAYYPFSHIFYFLPNMVNHYIENWRAFTGYNFDNHILNIDSSITFSYRMRYSSFQASDEYQDSIRKQLNTEKLSKKQRSELTTKLHSTSSTFRYEFSLQDTLLISLSEKAEDESILHEYASAEYKNILKNSDFNNPQYNSDALYDYRNYSQGYTYVLSYDQQQKANREKLLNNPAPTFELPIVGEDKTAKLEDYKGKWILLDFWFIGCKPCMLLMPEIEKLYSQYHAKGLEIIGINVDKNNERLQNFVKEKNLPYPTLNTEDKSVSKLYGVFGYPTLILINPQQKVIIYKGSINEIEQYLKNNLK